MGAPELSVEEIRKLDPGEVPDDLKRNEAEVTFDELHRLCDMALRATKAEKELHEARVWIADATKEITNLVGGGSELFRRHGDDYRADIEFCVERIRDRRRAHERWITAVCEKKEAKAALRATKVEALPEEVAGIVKRLRYGAEGYGHSRFILREAADTIEALNAARVRAEATNKRLVAQFRNERDALQSTESERDHYRRAALRLCDCLDAASASRDALVKAVEPWERIVNHLLSHEWVTDKVEFYVAVGPNSDFTKFTGVDARRSKDALRTARDAAISPDEARSRYTNAVEYHEGGNVKHNAPPIDPVTCFECDTPLEGPSCPKCNPPFPVTVAEVLEVLEPFAECAAGTSEFWDDKRAVASLNYRDLKVEHLRRARFLCDKLAKGRAALGEPE